MNSPILHVIRPEVHREVLEMSRKEGMASKSFYEVLETQIRAELRAELEAELRGQKDVSADEAASSIAIEGAAGRLETWLVSHVEKTHFSREQLARRAYGTGRGAASSASVRRALKAIAPEERSRQESATIAPDLDLHPKLTVKFQARSLEDLCRVELLRRHGAELGDSFSAQELKSAWRKAALKTHPDRFTQADPVTQRRMAERFRELTEAYGELAARIETEAQKAPLAA